MVAIFAGLLRTVEDKRRWIATSSCENRINARKPSTMKNTKRTRKVKGKEAVRCAGMVSRDAMRAAVAAYMSSEGCTCCRDYYAHEKHSAALGKLLKVPKHKNGWGYDFERFKAKENARISDATNRK